MCGHTISVVGSVAASKLQGPQFGPELRLLSGQIFTCSSCVYDGLHYDGLYCFLPPPKNKPLS